MKNLLRGLGSLQLTAWLLAGSMLLVFFGTLDQVPLGLHEAQRKYFQGIIAIWNYPAHWPGGERLQHLALPIPGGYLLGPLLVLNLLAAHVRFFRPSLRTTGIALIHGGILVFLIGQFATDLGQEDAYIWLKENESGSYTEAFQRDELVVIDTTAPDKDRVLSIPATELAAGRVLTAPGFPIKVAVRTFYRNARIGAHTAAPGAEPSADKGLAAQQGLVVRSLPPTSAPNERNATTAVVELLAGDKSLGSWLVSVALEEQAPQTFEHEGRTYEIGLRPRRTYLPFTLKLLDFTHERYPGTEIPRNFASTVQLQDPRTGTDRKTVISMNEPLRYDGLAFYQASFAQQDTASMLQVVRNPGRLLPYIACALVTLGMLWQFGWSLWRYLGRREEAKS